MDIHDILDAGKEGTNIALLLDENQRNKIAQDVMTGYKEDYQSMKDWITASDAILEQIKIDLSTKPDGTSNVKYPLLTTAVVQFASRAYPTIVQSSNVVRLKINVPPDDPKYGPILSEADKVAQAISAYLLEDLDYWETDLDILLQRYAAIGFAVKKTFWCGVKKRMESYLLGHRDVIFNNSADSFSELHRITHVRRLQYRIVKERARQGSYIPLPDDYSPDSYFQTEKSENSGTPAKNVETLLEQHCYIDLDNDGLEEPYVVTVHERTAKVLRIDPRFDEESIVWSKDLPDTVADEVQKGARIAEASSSYEVVSIKAREFFTPFNFLPPLSGGVIGMGFGTLMFALTEAVSTIINQLIDAGTLSNNPPGFVSSEIRAQKGTFTYKRGEYKSMPYSGNAFANAFYTIPIKEPSHVLYSLMGSLIAASDKMTSSSGLMAGQNAPTNQPATTTLALLKEGRNVMNKIFKSFHRSAKMEYKKIFEGYRDHNQSKLGQFLREHGLDLVPHSDPIMANDDINLAKAQAVREIMGMPGVNPVAATTRYLQLVGIPGYQALIMQPPPPPDPSKDMDNVLAMAKLEIDKSRVAVKEAEAITKAKAADAHIQKELAEAKRLMLEVLQAVKQSGAGQSASPPAQTAEMKTEQIINAAKNQNGNVPPSPEGMGGDPGQDVLGAIPGDEGASQPPDSNV